MQIDYTPPPGHEHTLSPHRYRLLVDEAVRVVAQRYAVERVERGVIHLAGEAGATAVVNLHNILAAVADHDDEAALLDAVHAHVNTLHDAAAARERVDLSDYAVARPRLVARVYPLAAVEQYVGRSAIVMRQHLPGTYSLLMLDLEGAFSSVSRARLSEWGVSEPEAFAATHVNAATADVKLSRTEIDLGTGPLALYLAQEENLAASFALALGAHTPVVVGEHGALVAVPSRALAVVLPLPPAAPKDVAERFARAARKLIDESYAGHPYAVSTEVFWLRRGGGYARITGPDGEVRTPLELAAVLGGSQ